MNETIDLILHYSWIVLVGLLCTLGVLLAAFRMPGTWLVLVLGVIAGWISGWVAPSTRLLLILAGAACAGEVVEFLVSLKVTQRSGASKYSAWAGIGGAIFGTIFLTFLVPIPLLGSAIGAVIGCASAAMLTELAVRRHVGHGAKVGVWAAAGFALGAMSKAAVAALMSAVVVGSMLKA